MLQSPHSFYPLLTQSTPSQFYSAKFKSERDFSYKSLTLLSLDPGEVSLKVLIYIHGSVFLLSSSSHLLRRPTHAYHQNQFLHICKYHQLSALIVLPRRPSPTSDPNLKSRPPNCLNNHSKFGKGVPTISSLGLTIF